MGIFTADEIRILLKRLRIETVVPCSLEFPFEVVRRRVSGYSDDSEIGALEAKLSIMLETA